MAVGYSLWEEVYLKDYRTTKEADADIGRLTEDVLSNRRLHSSLGYPRQSSKSLKPKS